MNEHPSPFPVDVWDDGEGHELRYVLVRHDGADDLIVHFSAFFGDWGDARPYRETFGGYFHRLKMLGTVEGHNWLFLCDPYGAHQNGTYYTGAAGDFFVERAVQRLVESCRHRLGAPRERVVTMGSSMGGTAAIKFALQLGYRGAVAIVPHIDLDRCAAEENRWAEVAFICPDGDPVAEHNFACTRQIAALVRDGRGPLPRLFVQSCKDDAGVYRGQVLPLVESWRARGGAVDTDVRPTGGHTSSWATRPLLVDAAERIIAGEPIDVARYQSDPAYAGTLLRRPLTHRLRHRAHVIRTRFARR